MKGVQEPGGRLCEVVQLITSKINDMVAVLQKIKSLKGPESIKKVDIRRSESAAG